jgi:hypothetical protein
MQDYCPTVNSKAAVSSETYAPTVTAFITEDNQ